MSNIKVPNKKGDCDKRIIGTLFVYEQQGLLMPDAITLSSVLGYSLPSIYDNIRALTNRD